MKIKRIKPTKKGKTFKKGDQCVQNPKTRKHRDDVKKSVFSQRKASRGLTVAALQKHDEVLDDEISLSGLTLGDASDVSSKSKAFSISGLTDCSNITFHNVLNKWTSTDALDQEKCAILAAVTEVIRSKGGSETETEYFAALMTALEACTDENSCTAVAFLLSLVIKNVPKAVLQKKCSEACKCFVGLLENYHEAGRASLLIALLQCLSITLTAQEPAVWSEASTQHTFQILLTFTIHSKPKVRKLAQSLVQSLIKLNLLNHKKHPVGAAVTRFAVQMVEEKRIRENSSIPHHVLNLLKQCLQYLSSENLKELCETVLGLLSLNDNILKVNTMNTLRCMFEANPLEESLSVDLNTKLISVLYEFQPSINDVNATSTWLSLMLAAHSNLTLIGEKSCFKILPVFFGKLMKCVLSENKIVVAAAADTMQKLSEACIEPVMALVEEDIKSADSVFLKIFRHVEVGLGFKYAPVWNVVLQSLHYMYLAFGKQCGSVFISNVGDLIDLHETPGFPFRSVLEKTVGGAIKSIGPEMVLKERPLNLIRDDETCQFPNAWLLSIMKDSIENTNLQFFISHFLPMAAQVRQKAIKYRELKQDLEAKVFETLLSQIWLLLPGFCTNPVDLKDSFPNIAKILGTALKDTSSLRGVVLQALRTIIAKTMGEEELKVIASYSKNYMPILFNLYTDGGKECEAISLSVLETIKAFLVITNKELISIFINSLLAKLEEKNDIKKQHHLMDLAVCMAKYAEDTQLESIYKLAVDHVNDGDRSIQKKSYRVFEELFYSNSESCKSLLDEKINELKPLLVSSLSSAAPSSKAPRLRCLSALVKKLDLKNKGFLQTIIPEVILCTKAINVKARNAAFDLIVDIGSAYVYLSNLPKEECIEKYFQFVMAGLAGSPHMVSGTLLTFTKLVHEYRYCISTKLVASVLENAIELLKSKTNEVVKASLFVVRAVSKTLDANELSGHLEAMVKNLFSRSATSKNVYKIQIRSILQRLEKKCGYKLILSLVPDEHKKFLVHIHKMSERSKRNREVREDEEEVDEGDNKESSWDDILADSDVDEEEKADKKYKKGKSTKQNRNEGKTWIVDGDEAVDLLDPSAAKKVVATKPKEKRKVQESEDFGVSSDGRLLIKEDEEEDQSDHVESLDIGEKDMLAGFDKAPKQIKLGKRKQLEEMPDTDEGYKPGGSGIHRKPDEPPSKQKRYGEEYKAKKSDGDVKLKGKPDPYAYIPLNRQKLNKRKTAKLSGQFHGMVKAARKGANKGSKHRKNVKVK